MQPQSTPQGTVYFRSNEKTRATILFSVTDKVGALDEILGAVKQLGVSLTRIESRPSLTEGCYDFFIDFDGDDTLVKNVVSVLTPLSIQVRVAGRADVPWFPRKVADLDEFSHKVLEYGQELSSDHPGFTDEKYRERRNMITKIAQTYRHGSPIPRIDYTPEENKTWGIVYSKLRAMYPTHACREVNYIYPLLEKNCGYGPEGIPQLQDISMFLKDCTGFTLRPVMGLLTSRDFLNGLAFRVFHSTQYIRHHSAPLYTPEPDVCHELMGHVPLFADPDFADFSQEIGLASLGASDDDIEKLSTIYWFTVEFGVCQQGNEIKAYGAGLLSSFGELEYCLTDAAQKQPFNPDVTAVTKYPITTYQPLYFVADSFANAKVLVREFTLNMKRPFTVRYNAYTQTVEVLDKKSKLMRYALGIKSDMQVLADALSHLECE